ncbi:unnamed protein product [Diplocarpon coronariae]|uniref:Zn(2)-C6 fungal-type domain-containing protein n=1 Tax=Diplocarpon coronariae TaxID=2795749 RepID=A0A218YRU1_9HELO|nr:hypothetical protein B2J93_9153 [Marssonina coronariae]
MKVALSLEAEKSPRKNTNTRRSAPKAKSGCLTCKIRRVKCDEQKPSCLRCLKFGIQCDGYATPKAKGSRSITRPSSILLPKVHPLNSSILRGPPSSRFESEAQFRYFEVFSRSTAYEIFPNVEMARLRLMFLQICESQKAVRHGVAALGALTMTSRAIQSQGNHTLRNSTSNHYHRAVREYAQAIKYAQLDGQKDLRTALITSLVILSFEGWVGNHEAAFQQIRIGASLLREWKERQRWTAVPGYAIQALDEEEEVLSHVFTRLSIQSRSPPSDRPQPLSPSSSPPPLRIDVPKGLMRIPEVFGSLNEAGKSYSAIVRSAVVFVSQDLPRIARSSSLTGTYTAGAVDAVIPPEIIRAKAALAESIQRWMAAFSPLKIAANYMSLNDRKASITLELQMKATFMGTVKSLAQDELVFDGYHQVYGDIVNLCEELLKCSEDSTVPKFSFDSAVIIPLWFTGHKCRSPVLRRRVISLLLKYPRREGVWDSIFAGLVIDCLRGFEEQYIEDGRVPGWARIRETKYEIDLVKRTVEVRCEQRTSPTSQGTVMRRKTLGCYIHTGIPLEQIGAVIAR